MLKRGGWCCYSNKIINNNVKQSIKLVIKHVCSGEYVGVLSHITPNFLNQHKLWNEIASLCMFAQ